MGQEEWDCARTLAGRPALGSEMGPGVGCTPLEAGLYHAVNLGKTLGSAGVQALAAAEAAGKGSQLWGLELEVRGGLERQEGERGNGQLGGERKGSQLWGLELEVRRVGEAGGREGGWPVRGGG